MRASPGQEAWITPELLEDDELDDNELDEDGELEENELDENEELEESELNEDEEPERLAPPQPPTVNNDKQQALINARFAVNTLFI